jgi:hypothetical protein
MAPPLPAAVARRTPMTQKIGENNPTQPDIVPRGPPNIAIGQNSPHAEYPLRHRKWNS